MFWIKTSDVVAVVETADGCFTILFYDGKRLKNVAPQCAREIICEIQTPKSVRNAIQ